MNASPAPQGIVTGRHLIECLLVFLVAGSVYVSLYGDLPIDDTSRFTESVAAGRCTWDPGHLFMQPATVAWHAWIGDPLGFEALDSQHHINTFSAALSLVLLFLLAVRIGVGGLARWLLVMSAGLGFHVLTLATSGHMKLTALPFLTLALYQAVLWERDQRGWRLPVSAVSLAVAALFLVNSIFILPLQCLVLLMLRTTGDKGRAPALKHAIVYGALTTAIFVGGMSAAYVGTTTDDPRVGGFKNFILEEKDTGGPETGLGNRVARAGYGVVLNAVHMEYLGPLTRAKMQGTLGDEVDYGSLVARDLVFAASASVLLAITFFASLLAGARGTRGHASAWAHWWGILLFAAMWNLNEADFFYQLTFPGFVMLALLPWPRLRLGVLVGTIVLAVTANLIFWAVPKARYPFHDYVADLQRDFTQEDLIVCPGGYPGKQCMSFFLPYLEKPEILLLNSVMRNAESPVVFYDIVRKRLNERPYRRIVLFRVLDPSDHNDPWPVLQSRGIQKEDLERVLRSEGKITVIEPIAEIPCWELKLGS